MESPMKPILFPVLSPVMFVIVRQEKGIIDAHYAAIAAVGMAGEHRSSRRIICAD